MCLKTVALVYLVSCLEVIVLKWEGGVFFNILYQIYKCNMYLFRLCI